VVKQHTMKADVTDVTGETWVKEFVLNPQSKYKEPYVESMINYFNLRMPNQGMTEEQVKDIIEYLKWVDENANLF